MAFVPVSNTASFELVYDVFGQVCENVFYVKKTSAFSEPNLTDFSEAIVDWFTAAGKNIFHTGCSLSKIVAKDLSASNGAAIEYTTGLPIAGTASNSDALPLNVTAAVSFGTALRGRSYRGRIYQIGLTKAMTASNQLNSTWQGDFVAKYAALVSAFSTAGGQMCVVSRISGGTYRTAGVATPITSVSVNINLDSQRRRLTGRGQ